MKDGHFSPAPKPDPKPKKVPQPLKRTAIKQKAYTLKRTPLKPSEKPIKQVSAKQARNLKAYEQGKLSKYENTPDVCESCGRNDRGISCSHIVPRSHSFDLVGNQHNHMKQCFVCHEATESMRFYELKNGLKILQLLWHSFGDAGRQRFWQAWHRWEQNQDLFRHSQFFDPEIHC